MPLTVGQMGDAAEPVDQMPAEFAGSMAAAIERAFDRLNQAEGRPPLALDDNSGNARDRRLLFVAIAQGITWYLQKNPGGLPVSGSVTAGGTVTGSVTLAIRDGMDLAR